MKFKIERDALGRAVAAASRTVSPKSSPSFLEGICVEAVEETLRITGYNLETGITVTEDARVLEAGSCIMPCRMFGDIVRKLRSDIVSVEVDKEYRVLVQGGGASFRFQALTADDYPMLPAVEEEHAIHMPQAALRKMINGTIFAVSYDGGPAGNTTLTGCLIDISADSITMIGCDSYRMAARTWAAEGKQFPELQFVVAAAGLKELEKILDTDGDKEVCFVGNKTHICFSVDNSTLVCRLMEGKYLPWRRLLQKDAMFRLTANTADLTAAVERVALITSEKYKAALRCIFGLNGVELRTTTTVASAVDGCRLDGDGKDTEIAFSPRYMLEALKAVPSDEVTLLFNGGLKPFLLVPGFDSWNYCYLINPVRTVPGQN